MSMYVEAHVDLHSAKTIGKDMNPTIIRPVTGNK